MKLSESTLNLLPKELTVPEYDRSKLSENIVHFGVGHFHRAHLAMYLDKLLSQDPECNWGIRGVEVASLSDATINALESQDWLYTLTQKFPDGSAKSSVIGSIIGIEHAKSGEETVISRLADSNTKIISLTITEVSYGTDEISGKFSGKGDKLIEADLADPSSRASWLGLLVHAIRRRKESGAGKVTLMSCDNIPHNGKIAHDALIGFAKVTAPDLLGWIDENMTFPTSMVDRVTPGTTDEDRQYLIKKYGFEDNWPVACEPYVLWVVEDNFANGRPDFGKVGVNLVPDALPYELLKLRTGNGTHQALCYFGALLGYKYVHEAVHDPDINALLNRYINEEAVPTLEKIPGIDLNEYGKNFIDRFGNPQIRDLLSRICADTSARIPKFLLPVVRDQIAIGGSSPICAAVVASWARYAEGLDENGASLDITDPMKEEIRAAVKSEASDPGAFLKLTSIFGELGSNKEFLAQYLSARDTIHKIGVRGLLKSLR